MRHQIPVYRAEIEAGVADAVRAHASVAYVVPAEELRGDEPAAASLVRSEQVQRAYAALAAGAAPAEDDLFRIKDILVTVGWNKNDDVFDRIDVWAARHTSEDKPFNFEHNQNDIIGHIVACQAVAEDMTPLADDLAADAIPAKYHILNGSVIYRHIGDEERRARTERTIAEIRRGEWCVSMECFFRGFDYAVQLPDGRQAVVGRDERTAFLTKHLRAYGGTGTYADEQTGVKYGIGRVFRNVTFCGKGLVRKPANPESVILHSAAAFRPTNQAVISSSTSSLGYLLPEPEVTESSTEAEAHTMAENAADVTALQAKIGELQASNDKLVADLASQKAKDYEATVASLKSEVAAKAGEVDSLKAQVETIKAAATEAAARAAAADTALAEAKAEVAAGRAAETRRARLAVLAEKGATAEAAAKLVEKLASLDDPAFAETADVLAAGWKRAETAAPARKTGSQVIDEATTEPDAALATAATDAESAERAKAAVVEFFSTNVLRSARSGRTQASE